MSTGHKAKKARRPTRRSRRGTRAVFAVFTPDFGVTSGPSAPRRTTSP